MLSKVKEKRKQFNVPAIYTKTIKRRKQIESIRNKHNRYWLESCVLVKKKKKISKAGGVHFLSRILYDHHHTKPASIVSCRQIVLPIRHGEGLLLSKIVINAYVLCFCVLMRMQSYSCHVLPTTMN